MHISEDSMISDRVNRVRNPVSWAVRGALIGLIIGGTVNLLLLAYTAIEATVACYYIGVGLGTGCGFGLAKWSERISKPKV